MAWPPQAWHTLQPAGPLSLALAVLQALILQPTAVGWESFASSEAGGWAATVADFDCMGIHSAGTSAAAVDKRATVGVPAVWPAAQAGHELVVQATDFSLAGYSEPGCSAQLTA